MLKDGKRGRQALTRLQGRDHDDQIHESIVDLSCSGLDDVDIFASHRVLDLTTSLTNRELAKDPVAGRHTQVVADPVDQLRMRVSTEDNDISNHVDDQE
jgi:hypothetical protein